MTRLRRIRWRWVVIGGGIWLILLSSISLQTGHTMIAQWAATAAISTGILGAIIAVLRLITLAVIRGIRGAHRSYTRALRTKGKAQPTASRAR